MLLVGEEWPAAVVNDAAQKVNLESRPMVSRGAKGGADAPPWMSRAHLRRIRS